MVACDPGRARPQATLAPGRTSPRPRWWGELSLDSFSLFSDLCSSLFVSSFFFFFFFLLGVLLSPARPGVAPRNRLPATQAAGDPVARAQARDPGCRRPRPRDPSLGSHGLGCRRPVSGVFIYLFIYYFKLLFLLLVVFFVRIAVVAVVLWSLRWEGVKAKSFFFFFTVNLNRVLETRFTIRYHVEIMPTQTRVEHANWASKTRFTGLKSSL